MKLLLVDNVHIYRTPDGEYYTPTIYNQAFFQRYLNVFSSVRLAAKTKHVESLDTSSYIHLPGGSVEIFELPWYRGLKELFRSLPELIKRIRKSNAGCDCAIFRVAQIESFLVYLFGKGVKKTFAVEVVNDPYSFSDVNPLFKYLSVFMLKMMAQKAAGAAYVTEYYLQQRYPCRAISDKDSRGCFTASYSSIELDEANICPPKAAPDHRPFRLIHVANVIDGEAKGHRTVLDAVKLVAERGYDVFVTFVGECVGASVFSRYAEELGIEDRVEFTGRISDKKRYFETLRQADMLVFPSHSEGLPRVVIEAMAAGLPCITSFSGGASELLAEDYLVDYRDVNEYAEKIIRFITDRESYCKASSENTVVAGKYTQSTLTQKRNAFYMNLYKAAKSNLSVGYCPSGEEKQ